MIGLALALGVASAAAAQNPVHWSVKTEAKGPLQAGSLVTVTATADIDAGWHMYALSQTAGGPIALTLTISPGPFTLDGAIVVLTPPETTPDPNFNIDSDVHEGRASPCAARTDRCGHVGRQSRVDARRQLSSVHGQALSTGQR